VADVYSHEAACTAQGGHLTSYISLLEQLEVEDQFLNLGVLLPTFHLRYWIGLYIPYRDPKLWPGGSAIWAQHWGWLCMLLLCYPNSPWLRPHAIPVRLHLTSPPA
jgi:hypothetical protein